MDINSPLIKKYQSALQKSPDSRVFAPLAEIYRKLGMTNEALAVLKKGISKNPTYTLGYLGIAFCYNDLKEYNLAYTTLRPLISSNRDNLRMQKLFAHVSEMVGSEEESLETYKYLLFVNPKDEFIAGKVSELERKLSSEYMTEESQTLKSEASEFNVGSISHSPLDKSDEWVQVDLRPKTEPISSESEKEAEVLGPWQQVKSIEEHRLSSTPAQVDFQENGADSPVITHTLVDLYISQGHFEKAKEILEKILDLAPSDKKTQTKLEEVEVILKKVATSKPLVETKNLMEASETEESFPEDAGRENLMNIIDHKFSTDISKQEDKIEKLKQFLSKIQSKSNHISP